MDNYKTYQVNDEVFCSSCARVWGVNEPKPECSISDQHRCKSIKEYERVKVGREMIKKLKTIMS